jgi:hypothetical protein
MKSLSYRCVLGLAALVSLPIISNGQGFSGPMGLGPAKTVGIKQLLPAAVNLNQKRIKIEATSAIQTNGELVKILETKLRTMIQRDPRFIVDERNPQTLLKFTVTNSYVEEKHYSVPGPNNTMQPCVGYTGKLEVSYQAMDSSNQAPLDSENLVASIIQEESKQGGGNSWGSIFHVPSRGGTCGTAAKSSTHEAQDELVDGIVHQMGQRAAPTEEILTVKLPGRKLEPLSRLALAQRWKTLEEEAEKADKLPKPEDDAYRVYLIALAKEAQAYEITRESAASVEGKRKDIPPEQAEAEFQKAQRLLDDARKLYKDAIQAKPNEKEFQEPDNRMEKAVAIYATIERDKEEYQKFVASSAAAKTVNKGGTGTNSGGGTPGPAPVATASATNPLEQIVKYCQSNIDMATISDYIKDPGFLDDAKASKYKFDLRTDPFTLNSNCKDKAPAIQKMMRDRLSGGTRASTGGSAKK